MSDEDFAKRFKRWGQKYILGNRQSWKKAMGR